MKLTINEYCELLKVLKDSETNLHYQVSTFAKKHGKNLHDVYGDLRATFDNENDQKEFNRLSYELSKIKHLIAKIEGEEV